MIFIIDYHCSQKILQASHPPVFVYTISVYAGCYYLKFEYKDVITN